MKKLVLAALLFPAPVGLVHAATTASIGKTTMPATLLIFSNGSGGSSSEYFNLTGSDFSGNQLNVKKTLTSVGYTVASYIGAASDAPQICYYTPYTTKFALCVNIAPGTSVAGFTQFNKFPFGNGAQISIVHNVIGTPGANLRPSGMENVTFNYTY